MALVCLCRGNFYWPPHTTILFFSIFLDKIVLDTLKSRYHRSAPLGIATGLADAFGTDVNGLPLSLIVSWYEQKAVADLLALLSLGIKGIYLGPTLPAFLSPNVLQYLVDTFDLRLITNAEDDIKTCLKQNI